MTFRSISLLSALGAFLSIAAASAGATTITPGLACRSASNHPTSQIVITSTPAGVSNIDPYISRGVICPLSRGSSYAGAQIYIEGMVNQGKYLTCTVYSHNYNGQQLASRNFTAPNGNATNVFDGLVSFTADEAPYYASLSAVCTLPSQGSGRVFSFSVSD